MWSQSRNPKENETAMRDTWFEKWASRNDKKPGLLQEYLNREVKPDSGKMWDYYQKVS